DGGDPSPAAGARPRAPSLAKTARRKQAAKHGGGTRRVPLEEFHRVAESPEDLLDLDDVLTRFAAEEPDKARLVQLRFFAGLSTPDAAAALGISVATAERWWAFARAWLYSELQGGEKKSIDPCGGAVRFFALKAVASPTRSPVMNQPSQAEVIFFAALEKATPAARAAYLEEACAGDDTLRRRVETLLAAHPQVGQFLERPVVEAEG